MGVSRETVLFRECIKSWDVEFFYVSSAVLFSPPELSFSHACHFSSFLLAPHATLPSSLEYPHVSSPSFQAWTPFHLTQWSRWRTVGGKGELDDTTVDLA